jgi:putative transposase
VLCSIKPLDKAANADGQRRRLDPVGRDLSPLPPTGLAPLLRELLAEYAATGMPPAYLSSAAPAPAHAPSSPPEADPA